MHVQVLCPHCQNTFESQQEVRGELVCPACGSTFWIEQDRTRTSVVANRRLGKFELLDEVGSGAFGVVWRARDSELDRLVAVKIPNSGRLAGEKETQRFVREARSAAQLRHPGIVTVHEVGRFENLPYIVADFVQGLTLADFLELRRPDHRESAELVARVADALDYAHAMGVVHRDVKPSNIMLEQPGQGRGMSNQAEGLTLARPMLMDFGLALREDVEATMTQEGEVLGTPAYMSPEQAGGCSHRVDARTDVYSLGVVLYRLLSGALPFRGNIRLIVNQVLHEEPQPPRLLDKTIPRDLETICLKAMAKLPAHRYQSARALADDLRRFLGGETIEARPVYFWERAWRWMRRRPAAAALVGVSGIAVLTLVGLGVALGYQSRLQAKNAEIEGQRVIAVELKGEAENALAREHRANYYNLVITADRELEDNNPYHAESLLDQCPEAQRNWEWHYLKRQCHTDLLTMGGHEGTVYAIAFSPDGHLIASAGDDKTVRIRAAETGREIRVLRDHKQTVWSIAFSPDGTRLASISGWMNQPALLRIHEVATGRKELDIPAATGTIAGLDYSHDGRFLAVASGETDTNGCVRIHDTGSGREVLRLDLPVKAAYTPCFSPDGSRLTAVVGLANPVSVITPNEVLVWETATGKVRLRLRGHTAPAMSAVFSPDGRLIASGGYDGTVHVWDANDGRERLVFRGHRDTVNRLVFSPDSAHVASASDDGSAQVWDSRTGQVLLTLRGHRGPFWSLAFSPDGRRLVTGGVDGLVKLWDATAARDALTGTVSNSSVWAVAYSPDGSHLATGSMDHRLRVWEVRPGGLSIKWTALHTDSIWDLAYSSDGTRLATASGDWTRKDGPGEVRLWDAATGRPVWAMPAHRGIAWSVAFRPDGKRLVSGGGEVRTPDQEVVVWDAESGLRLRAFPELEAGATNVAYSPDGRRIAAAVGEVIRVWDAETGENTVSLKGHESKVTSLAFHRDGQRLVSGGEDTTLRIWDIASGRTITCLRGHKGGVYSLAFSPDGSRLASSSSDRTVRLWDPEAGQELIGLRGHTAFIRGLAFSPDGQTIASCDQNGFVKLWNGSPLSGGAR